MDLEGTATSVTTHVSMCLHPILALNIYRYTRILSNSCDIGKEHSGLSYSSNKMTRLFDQKSRVAVDWTGPLQIVKGGRVTMKSGCFHTYFFILLKMGYFLPLLLPFMVNQLSVVAEADQEGELGDRGNC